MPAADVLVVSLGSTAGLRAADDALAGALRRAGAHVEIAAAHAPRELRTFALTDLAWAHAARVAARAGIAAHEPRAIVYSTTTAALLWPRPGAIRYDAPAAANRPGRHGVWQRPLEAPAARRRAAARAVGRRLARRDAAPARGRGRRPDRRRALAATGAPRDIAAITYAANPQKKGLDRVLRAWAQARTGGRATRRRRRRPGARRRAGRACRRAPRARRVPRPAAPRPRVRHRPAARGLRHRPARGARRRLPARDDRGARPVRRAPARPRARPAARRRRRRARRRAAHRPRRARAGLRTAGGAALAAFSPAAVDAVVRDELLPRLLGWA